jgi:hypothetical protein
MVQGNANLSIVWFSVNFPYAQPIDKFFMKKVELIHRLVVG